MNLENLLKELGEDFLKDQELNPFRSDLDNPSFREAVREHYIQQFADDFLPSDETLLDYAKEYPALLAWPVSLDSDQVTAYQCIRAAMLETCVDYLLDLSYELEDRNENEQV